MGTSGIGTHKWREKASNPLGRLGSGRVGARPAERQKSKEEEEGRRRRRRRRRRYPHAIQSFTINELKNRTRRRKINFYDFYRKKIVIFHRTRPLSQWPLSSQRGAECSNSALDSPPLNQKLLFLLLLLLLLLLLFFFFFISLRDSSLLVIDRIQTD